MLLDHLASAFCRFWGFKGGLCYQDGLLGAIIVGMGDDPRKEERPRG